jgi:hypothetical protein
MRFSRKINYGVRLVGENIKNRRSCRNITADEVVSFFVETLEIIQISGVRKGVETSHLRVGHPFEKQANKSRANEPGAACDKELKWRF